MAKSTTSKISGWEKFWIVLASLFIVAGLFFAILGIVGSHLPVEYSDNWILSSQAKFESKIHLTYRWFGVILLAIGAVVGTVSLNLFEKKSDADTERAERRAQRMKIISDSAKEEKPVENSKEGATQVESKPVEEKQPEAAQTEPVSEEPKAE